MSIPGNKVEIDAPYAVHAKRLETRDAENGRRIAKVIKSYLGREPKAVDFSKADKAAGYAGHRLAVLFKAPIDARSGGRVARLNEFLAGSGEICLIVTKMVPMPKSGLYDAGMEVTFRIDQGPSIKAHDVAPLFSSDALLKYYEKQGIARVLFDRKTIYPPRRPKKVAKPAGEVVNFRFRWK